MSGLPVLGAPRTGLPRACVGSALAAIASRSSVAVCGGPGAGKSHTLRALARSLRADGWTVHGIAATASMASVPFGALLPLLPADGSSTTDPGWLTLTAGRIVDSALADPRSIVLVDDAHLLDSPSAGVLHQVALAGGLVVVGIRSTVAAPDAIAALRSSVGVQVDVDPLDAPEVEQLCVVVLGMPVDEGLVRAVVERTAGLPLAVLTMLRLARDTGHLDTARGRGVLVGALPPSRALALLVQDSLVGMSGPAREAAELVALAEGMDEKRIGRLGGLDAVAEAERAGVLARSPGGYRVAHPLFVDALLADLPPSRRRRHLESMIGSGVGSGPVDDVRTVGWMLELGRRVPPQRLLDLSAAVVIDPELTERFVRAAVDTGGGIPAQLRLAEVLAHQHRGEEAEEVLDAIDLDALDSESRVAVQVTRAFLMVFPLARPEDGLELLAPLRSGSEPPMVSALAATAGFYAGQDPVEVGAQAKAIMDQEANPPSARAHAALTYLTSLVARGADRERDAARSTITAAVEAGRDEIPEGPGALRLLDVLALARGTLDLDAIEVGAEAGRLHTLHTGNDGDRAQFSHLLGTAALLRGDVGRALDLLRRAASGRGRWTGSNRVLVSTTLTTALTMSGDLVGAKREREASFALAYPPVVHQDVDRAGALLIAAVVSLAAGAAAAVRTAGVASGYAIEIDCWYDAVRFGRRSAAESLLRVVGRLDAPARDAQAAHARGLRARDPDAIEGAAHELERLGLGWYAVEAMAAAVLELRSLGGDDRSASARLVEMASRYPSLRSPVAAAVLGPVLTSRERAVVALVLDGCTSREASDRLGIGVRTVETHLAHVYRKLGIDSRRGLRAALRRGD